MGRPSLLFLFACLIALVTLVRDAAGFGWNFPKFFRIVVTWEPGSPDGVERNMTWINGQFPGPLLELDQGDEVYFLVENQMPFNTSIHFHGIQQHGTPWSDGVPGITQRPIPPGEWFLYRWTATQYGSYWYHAHAQSQIDDGLYGPILIHPSPHAEPELPLDDITDDPTEKEAISEARRHPRTLMVGDWHHKTAAEVYAIEKASGIDMICFDAILINGKGSVECPTEEELADPGPMMGSVLGNQTLTDKGCAPPTVDILQGDFEHHLDKLPDEMFYTCKDSQGSHESFEVDSHHKWVAFDIVSSAGLNVLGVSFDEHPMWVYAVDGRHIEPYKVHYIHLDAGTRYSVVLKLDKPKGDYTIRVNSVGFNQFLTSNATLTYKGEPEKEGESKPYMDRFGFNATADAILFDQTKAIPFPPDPPGQDADDTFIFDVGRFGKSYQWTVNGIARYPELTLANSREPPLLFDPSSANSSLTISTRNNTWVDLVFRSRPFNPPHPMHKHFNKAFIIGSGAGEFNYKTVAEAIKDLPDNFNLENPIPRDGWFPPPAVDGPTWVAVRYHVSNPGAVFLHCHIQIHLTGGMGMTILDGIDAWPEVPPEYKNGNGIREDIDWSQFVDL